MRKAQLHGVIFLEVEHGSRGNAVIVWEYWSGFPQAMKRKVSVAGSPYFQGQICDIV